ncbi:uncharacterized protein LOC143696599 isoform X3 [Agelaius phoeniceus]|uniref:uncharacterized protein LOC143696599 isoform X3 n=1 Tax=Agelaius phoeniceus TaxID=39638 RepID=UPI0040550B9B
MSVPAGLRDPFQPLHGQRRIPHSLATSWEAEIPQDGAGLECPWSREAEGKNGINSWSRQLRGGNGISIFARSPSAPAAPDVPRVRARSGRGWSRPRGAFDVHAQELGRCCALWRCCSGICQGSCPCHSSAVPSQRSRPRRFPALFPPCARAPSALGPPGGAAAPAFPSRSGGSGAAPQRGASAETPAARHGGCFGDHPVPHLHLPRPRCGISE